MRSDSGLVGGAGVLVLCRADDNHVGAGALDQPSAVCKPEGLGARAGSQVQAQLDAHVHVAVVLFEKAP